MPKLSKMSEDQIKEIAGKPEKKESQRQIIRRQYKELLKSYQPGEWVSVDLEKDESRTTERNRLSAAAKELGWKLEFKRVSGGKIAFEIKQA